ncbi:MAG: flagellar hook-basal body complex protein, partial [Burkholderiaceae bacterium]
MGFQQGLSGLNAASKSLDVIGNNVANSGTVGFKGAEAQFADVYASSLTGAGTSQVGIGTQVTQVAQQFTQGNITASNNPLDIAINGGGFFRMDNNGAITYGRNGQFQLDKSGYIINSNGSRLTGYIANAAGVLSTGAPADIKINTADIAPQVTTKVGAVLNLDSRSAVIPAYVPAVVGPPAVPASGTAFNATDPTTYNNATSVQVYDTLGNSHVMQTFFKKTQAS